MCNINKYKLLIHSWDNEILILEAVMVSLFMVSLMGRNSPNISGRGKAEDEDQ